MRGGNRSRVEALGGAPVFSLNCWRSPQRPQHSARPPPHPSSSSKMARSLLDSQPQGALLPAASPWQLPAPETTRVNLPSPLLRTQRCPPLQEAFPEQGRPGPLFTAPLNLLLLPVTNAPQACCPDTSAEQTRQAGPWVPQHLQVGWKRGTAQPV